MKEPRLLLNIIQVLSDRLKESMTLIESLSLKEIPERLASFLLHDLTSHETDEMNRPESAREQLPRGLQRGKRARTGLSVPLKDLQLTITQRELAKILGVTPEALSRTIRKMTNAGSSAWTAGRSGFWIGRRSKNGRKGNDRSSRGGVGSRPIPPGRSPTS